MLRLFAVLVLFLIATAFCEASAQGQVVSIGDFSTTSILTMNGRAAVSGGVSRLTPATPSLRGSAVVAVPLQVVGGFETSFTFRSTPGRPPAADGFAFVVHNSIFVAGGVPIPLLLTLQSAVVSPNGSPIIQLTNAVTMDIR